MSRARRIELRGSGGESVYLLGWRQAVAVTRTLYTNAVLFTLDPRRPLIAPGALLVEGDEIAQVGAPDEIVVRDGEIVDLTGNWVTPGLINAHTHLYSVLFRGLVSGEPPKNQLERLERLVWPVDRAQDLADVRLSALHGLMDAARHGVTTVFAHHSSPAVTAGSLDVLAEVAEGVGLRVCLCYEVTDRNGPEGARRGIEENVRFLRRLADRPNPLLAATFGLHASFTLSDATLLACHAAEREFGCGFHVHVAETRHDVEASRRLSGTGALGRLARFGMLSDRTIAAHCVHLESAEYDLLAESGAIVVHNPTSNMNAAVGVADVPRLLAQGSRVAVGTDGFGQDVLAELRLAFYLHKLSTGDPTALPAGQVLDCGFASGGELVRRQFGRPAGRLAPGYLADFAVWDSVSPTPLTPANWPAHLLFSTDPCQLTRLVVGGRLVDGGAFSERETALTLQQRASALWGRVMPDQRPDTEVLGAEA